MKMRASEKRSLTWIFGIAYTSGLTLYCFTRFVRIQTDIGEQHHSMEHWIRVAHSLLTYGLALGLGFVIKSHVLPGLKSQSPRGKPSGLFLLSLFGTLIFSAVAFLYLSNEAWQTKAGQIHAYLGLSIPMILFFHLRTSLKKRS